MDKAWSYNFFAVLIHNDCQATTRNEKQLDFLSYVLFFLTQKSITVEQPIQRFNYHNYKKIL